MKLYALIEEYSDNKTPPSVILKSASLSRLIEIRQSYLDNISRCKKCHDCMLHTLYTKNQDGKAPDFEYIIQCLNDANPETDSKKTYNTCCYEPEFFKKIRDVFNFSSDNDTPESSEELEVWKCRNRLESDPMILTANYRIETIEE